jgi:hypothetical protein
MRRTSIALAAFALAAAFAAAPGLSAKGATPHALSFKVRLIQEQTIRHHKSADGDNHTNDTFSTSLRLFAMGTTLGYPDGTPLGRMAFNWGPLNGTCSSSAAGCSGTTNLSTVTKLPGGTLTAGGKNVSLAHGLIVPIESGTGIFKGAKGSIAIAPAGVAEDVFTIKLPG